VNKRPTRGEKKGGWSASVSCLRKMEFGLLKGFPLPYPLKPAEGEEKVSVLVVKGGGRLGKGPPEGESK